MFRYKKTGTNKTKQLKLSFYTWFIGSIIKLFGKMEVFKPSDGFSKIDYRVRKIGMRRIDRELDIARFIRK